MAKKSLELSAGTMRRVKTARRLTVARHNISAAKTRHSQLLMEGRFEGFLVGAAFTAVAWLWTTRKSWAGA